MDQDDKIQWVESRVSSSLRPRPDDLKAALSQEETRAALLEFFANDDAQKVFVYTSSQDGSSNIKISLSAPVVVHEKCICFLKTGSASQLHSGNLDDSITCMDWSDALSHGNLLFRDVFLPLLCTDSDIMDYMPADNFPITRDKLMDVLHRLLGNIEITSATAEGSVRLPLPAIEVLAEAAAFQQRQSAVVHVLESAVIGWIRQIKNVLKHDPLMSTKKIAEAKKEPVRPHHEITMWNEHIEHLTSILEQLSAPTATDILMNLSHANSSYAHSFNTVQFEIEAALEEARSRLNCFTTVLPWIQDMYRTSAVDRIIKGLGLLNMFPPLLQTVLLIWKNSSYYHNVQAFSHLLLMLSNEVVVRARSLVGDNPFEDTQHSYTALKDSLRLCAAFRGTYLDYKETANKINDQNRASNIVTMARIRPKDHNVLFRAKMYGPTGFQQLPNDPQVDGSEDHWEDSEWPPRNTSCFSGLARFVERCNDLLDLVETTRHFSILEEAARVGGAGSGALDALVNDVHQIFIKTIQEFTIHNRDVLTIDSKQHFEKAFFRYRSVIKTLERRLADVLRTALKLCPNVMSHLRLLEVFEGISARELLQLELSSENDRLVKQLISDFKSVKEIFNENCRNVPMHANMPPTISKLVWVRGLKGRIMGPMNKIRSVCAHSLESDAGWMLRDIYTETMNELEKYENRLITSWTKTVDCDIRERLKSYVLCEDDYDSTDTTDSTVDSGTDVDTGSGPKPMRLKVNLDNKFLVILRDVKCLQQSPHDINIPPALRAVLRDIDSNALRQSATRLRTVISKYNYLVSNLKPHEEMLFENKMKNVMEVITEGTETITWGSADFSDFLEKVSAVVCDSAYDCLTRVQNNWSRITLMAQSWSEGVLDIFTAYQKAQNTMTLDELISWQKELDLQYKSKVMPMGTEIHTLLADTFKVVEMSEASPAWQLYIAQMDALVLIALKSSILTSLEAMYTTISINPEETEQTQPILMIRLELVEQTVSFSPPLDRMVSVDNIEDSIASWLGSFLKRATLIKRLTDPSNSYTEFLTNDNDVWEIVEEIQNVVNANASQCKDLLLIFDNYRFLWVQDVLQSFKDFLHGRPSPNPLRSSQKRKVNISTMESHRYSSNSPDPIIEAERTFLTPHHDNMTKESHHRSSVHSDNKGGRIDSSSIDTDQMMPGLNEFDDEIGIYKRARDDISDLPDVKVVGWIQINFQPIKQVLITYASKWMWTFTKYLCNQVTESLDSLANFLAHTEPEIESITGEERDTATFMKMMRLFNEVSAQQQDMEERFTVMHRTVSLLEKYDMKLEAETYTMFRSAPDRWNHLKTKVSLAKQRLGPRIQEESSRITKDLLRFGDRVESVAADLRSSDVFSRDCAIHAAIDLIESYSKRLKILQREAQDLIELQELLENAVVNFAIVPQYQRDLKNLKATWEFKRIVEAEQRAWKMKHWQKIDSRQLQQGIKRQRQQVESLPPDVCEWDVYQGMMFSINVIEQCLPLVEDLNHPAMRTRHWKQLVRVTGGLLQTDSDSLKKMVLGDLLDLGLQKHADEVKAIVQRAIKDLTIESSLKTCEEVWLGKVFEILPHARGMSRVQSTDLDAGSDMTGGSDVMAHTLLQTHEGASKISGTRKSMKSANHSRSSDKTGPGSVSRGRGGMGRTSVLSLPISLLNLIDNPSPICLLTNVDKIFSELEHHQLELTRMQSNSAIGSFLDEVTKWQKKLQLVEAVLEEWVNVQSLWVQLDEIYSGADVRTALAHEANMFAVMSKDFRLLMRATEKNTNVLQSCSRKGLLPMLEKMKGKMEQCKHALLGNLERRRQRFPRFYFLSLEDVLNIVCYSYDLSSVNSYLCKLFPNLGRLQYEETDNVVSGNMSSEVLGKKMFIVNSVISSLGEKTTLSKPLVYEGTMSYWLPRLMESVKVTIQENLHVALGYEYRSAVDDVTVKGSGAAKVKLSRPSSAMSQKSGQSKKSNLSDKVPAKLLGAEETSELANQLSANIGNVPIKDVLWTLDNPGQVVLLATIIKLSEKMATAVEAHSKSDPMPLLELQKHIRQNLDLAVIMLKGMEDENSFRKSSGLKRSPVGEKQGGKNVEVDPPDTESLDAPSTRSLLEDDMDRNTDYNDDEDNFNEDILNGEAPINTMQSLLFTEQLNASSKAGKQNQPDHELAEILEKDTDDDIEQTGDAKLLLFPAQITKITSMIYTLAQYRDSIQFLLEQSALQSKSVNMKELFEYKSRLSHVYDEETMSVSVKIFSYQFPYGYEYQGSCERYVVSPWCDSTILSICHALNTPSGVLLSNLSPTSLTSYSNETIKELSYLLGRALYSVQCTRSVDHFMLADMFKGLSETGCWLCLENINNLSEGLLSVACQLSNEIHQELAAGKQSVILQHEEVQLLPTAALFATVNATNMPLKFQHNSVKSQFPAPTASLPTALLSSFRVINPSMPNERAVFEIHLLAQGFTMASEFAANLCLFDEMCKQFFSTLPGGSRLCGASESLFNPSTNPEVESKTYPVTLKSISQIIESAGVILDNFIHERMDKKQEYREMVVAKTKKFTEIWKYKSSTSGSVIQESGPDAAVGGVASSSSLEPTQEDEKSVSPRLSKLDMDVEAIKKMEEESLVLAIRNHLMPRFVDSKAKALLSTILMDLWTEVDVDFGIEFDEKDRDEAEQWNLNMNAEVSIPVHVNEQQDVTFHQTKPEVEAIDSVEAAVAIATTECALIQAASFQAKIAQMIEMVDSLKSIIITGPPGSGKSECVNVYVETQKQLGANVEIEKVSINALNSSNELFGFYDEMREWKDGLFQHLLRRYCHKDTKVHDIQALSRQQSSLLLLHIDGDLRSSDFDMFSQMLTGSAASSNSQTQWISLPNNERMSLPLNVRLCWEMSSLCHLSPAALSTLAVLSFSDKEITWKVHLTHWLSSLPAFVQEILRPIIDEYIPKLVAYFSHGLLPSHIMSDSNKHLSQTIPVSCNSMTITFCRLLNGLLTSNASTELTPDEYGRYIGYSAFWAFGGTLDDRSREFFGTWWSNTWPTLFPEVDDIWCLFVESDTRDFMHWEDHIPQFSGFSHSAQTHTSSHNAQLSTEHHPSHGDMFVHTPHFEQLTHLMGTLNDSGHPVMVVGPLGCGKTSLVKERVNAVSSGEVAEVLSLFIHCNRLTEADILWKRISNMLEWKHGKCYTPKGNKKLICVVDDLNLSRPLNESDVDGLNLQSACEIIRQHIDFGGVRNPSNYKWQQVSNVAYVTTINPKPPGLSCTLPQRVTRHFSVLCCPFPSAQSQHAIFSTILNSHFLTTFGSSLSGTVSSADINAEKPLQNLLSDITKITIEIQERLRMMYIATIERAHYSFTLLDLNKIFNNLVLSLKPACHQLNLLLLWRHECDWIFGKQMTSDVDLDRYHQVFDTAFKKHLTENKYLPIIVSNKQPLFSNIRELDGGLVTAGRYFGRTPLHSTSAKGIVIETTDMYKAVDDLTDIRKLLVEALKEYNKVNVQIHLSFYEETIAIICRIARILQSPHTTGHVLLFGEGCPVLSRLSVNLAAHLGGFRVNSLPPKLTNPEMNNILHTDQRLQIFKQFVVNLYNQTGVKGEKVVFLVYDDRAVTHECLAVIEELIRHGAISHLFTSDEQTTISNAVRSEVTAAGLTYSKETAWAFFQNTVKKNLRIVMVCSEIGANFAERSKEFPSLFNQMNTIALRPWSYDQLIKNVLHHIEPQATKKHESVNENAVVRGDSILEKSKHIFVDGKKRENIAHLLANIHLTVKQKAENKFYKMPGNVVNYAFEKLIQRFIQIFEEQRKSVIENHTAIMTALTNIERENEIAQTLQKALDREKQILDEHKAGTLQLLAQIGQDMVITEQQVFAVKKQIKKIRHLKLSLPEYQLYHERAVFKAAAIVADTKKIVEGIDKQALSELRSLQKPDADMEEIMAAIIMILKSPNSDLTWSKGAKRQMANLERFLDELMNFDKNPLPLATLESLEQLLEKQFFTKENIISKTNGNEAAGALVLWVRGVVRYHAMMMSKVKPLHDKLQETSNAIEGAQHKLRQLESKKDALETRLRDLGEGFEQATADKNVQEEKRTEMEEHLRVAAQFQRVLAGEQKRCVAILNAYEDRMEWITGVSAITSAFATYLGPYPYMFRRMLLTVDWAQCLVQRGIPLVFDSIDPVKGHKIDFMLDVNANMPRDLDATPRDAASTVKDGNQPMEANNPDPLEVKESNTYDDKFSEIQLPEQEDVLPSSVDETTNSALPPVLPPVAEENDADDEGSGKNDPITPTKAQSIDINPSKLDDDISSKYSSNDVLVYNADTLPYISTEEYQTFIASIVTVLVGEDTKYEWMAKNYSHHQLQNAAILATSWQRPPLLLDPYLSGVDWYAGIIHRNKKIIPVNLSSKTDLAQITIIEKAVIAGNSLMLMDCEQQATNLIRPLVYHANTNKFNDVGTENEESRTVRFFGRRLVCPSTFQVCLSTTQPSSKLHADIISASQLITYIPTTETLQEDLLNRVFLRMQPELYRERRQMLHAIRQLKRNLQQLDDVISGRLGPVSNPKAMENSTKFLSNIVEHKAKTFNKLKKLEKVLVELNELVEGLYPIAHRAALLYSICRSLPTLNQHYQIPLPYFLHLFDSAVGSDQDEESEDPVLLDVEFDLPQEDESEVTDGEENSEIKKQKLRLGSATKVLKKKKDKPKINEDTETSSTTSEKIDQVKGDSLEQDNKSVGNIIVPQIADFPSNEVEYKSLEEVEVKNIIENVTTRVFANIYSNILPEHYTHVSALTVLSMQLDTTIEKQGLGRKSKASNSEYGEKGAIFTEEELTLLIQGNPGFGGSVSIVLEDFECTSPVPEWIPAVCWEDILAISVLPGPLEGICVHIAEAVDEWKEWFDQEMPENATIPGRGTSDEGEGDDVQEMTDFHKLLLIKILRPDRYKLAIENYSNKHAMKTPVEAIVTETSVLDLEQLLQDVVNTLGVFVLLPNKKVGENTLPLSCIDAIKVVGECHHNTVIEVVEMCDGGQAEVFQVIDHAHADGNWVVINNLHLAPKKFIEDLQLHLAQLRGVTHQSEEQSRASANFLVWLTALPESNIPSTFTQYLHKLSYHSLIKVALKTTGNEFLISPENSSIFKSTLLNLIHRVMLKFDSALTQVNELVVAHCYATAVVHALLETSQSYGSYGLTKFYDITDFLLQQALKYLLKTDGNSIDLFFLKKLYEDVIYIETDKKFFSKIFDEVMRQIGNGSGLRRFSINSVDVFIPNLKDSVSGWIKTMSNEAQLNVTSMNLTCVNQSIDKWNLIENCEIFNKELKLIFNAMQQPEFETSVAVASGTDGVEESDLIVKNFTSIQATIELCLEQLPPLLELGRVSSLLAQDYNFPYNRPSVISTVAPEEMHMPESIAYVLQQECVWFNQSLCRCRQEIHDLRQILLSNNHRIPPALMQTVTYLVEEEVPASWQHPSELPTTHTIQTWITFLHEKHKMFKQWIKSGMISTSAGSPVGNLVSVWPGGLINPNGLIVALCQEKAVLHETSFDQVQVRCKVLPSHNINEFPMQHEAAIYIKHLWSFNMKWDNDKECLVGLEPGDPEMNELPPIYVYPITQEEFYEWEEKQKSANSTMKPEPIASVPVFINKSRQSFVRYLNLPVADSSMIVSKNEFDHPPNACLVLQSSIDPTSRLIYKSRYLQAARRRQLVTHSSPDVSELMSRSNTRMSSDYPSEHRHRLSLVAALKRDHGGSITSIPEHSKVMQQTDENKEKTASQLSLASSHATNSTNKSQVNGQNDVSDKNIADKERPTETQKPLPNGGIKHKHTSQSTEPASTDQPPRIPGEEDAILRGVIPNDFFQVPDGAPSTEGSLLQTILDEEPRDDSSDKEGSRDQWKERQTDELEDAN